MVRDRTGNPGQLPVLSFFVFAYAWSWTAWLMAAAMGFAITEPPGLLLYLLGVLGPLVGAVWVARCGGRAYRREFLRRIWDTRGISARWWLALLAVAGGPAVIAAVGISVTGREAMAPGLSAGVVVAMVGPALVAGLAEEPGWRGAVSDAWQARTRPVWAAVGIGVLWSLWHLPLSFVEGSYYHNLGAGSVRVWLAHLMLVQLGILLVWLANGAGGSILLAVLAHAGFNAAIGLIAGSTTRDVVVLLALTAAAVTVTIMTNGRLGLPAGGAHERAGRSSPYAPPPTDGGPRSSSASGYT
jgi:membrane protease YdiL (CAAX protease family)